MFGGEMTQNLVQPGAVRTSAAVRQSVSGPGVRWSRVQVMPTRPAGALAAVLAVVLVVLAVPPLLLAAPTHSRVFAPAGAVQKLQQQPQEALAQGQVSRSYTGDRSWQRSTARRLATALNGPATGAAAALNNADRFAVACLRHHYIIWYTSRLTIAGSRRHPRTLAVYRYLFELLCWCLILPF